MHGSHHRACLLAAVGYAVACVGVIVGAALLSAPARAADLGANMALTSDYVWRGSSQTQEKPAAQAGLKLSGEGGWYASAWDSNVEFAPELSRLGLQTQLPTRWRMAGLMKPTQPTRLSYRRRDGAPSLPLRRQGAHPIGCRWSPQRCARCVRTRP